ncbi:MAG: choice-of-anchor D domain-containing protein [Ignavibacteria bacterium]|nr:choice-of-anchor D domain-containing protein [Ignavibacteria bacterium]
MKKHIYIAIFLLLSANLFSQTLIGVYPFPNYDPYTYLWGLTAKNDTLWAGTDYDNTTGYPYSMLYKITKTGNFLDSLATPFKFNHGLAWDGTGFWVAQDYTSGGAKLYKINTAGIKVDSILTGSYAQGIGGLTVTGNSLWFAEYYPDNTSYPYTYAYKMDIATKQLTDTIPLYGKQVQGVAIKGDTIFYVTDNFQGDNERIYAYRKAVGDTLFSFAAPSNNCDPRGMHWDGQNLYLLAYGTGNIRMLYKYQLSSTGNPIINTSSNLIDFGNVVVGTTSNQTLNISNTGSSKLIISGKTNTNPRFGITPNNVPDTIQPGANKNYTVTFNPNAYDTISGQLQIASNDLLTPVKVVTLTGKGVYSGAYIGLSFNSYNFQTRRVNSLCGYYFTVMNQGTNDLTISSMLFSTPRYRIDTTLNQFPQTIAPQGSKSYRIWFNPNSGSAFNDSLKINSNAVNLPTAIISLSGTGNTSLTALGDIMWQANTPDNPFTSSDDFQPISMKQIGDVNGDGINDIVVASGNYYTACWNGNSSVTGDLLWIFNTGYNNNNTGSVTSEDAMQVRDDVDGDGILDVVIGCGGGNEMVYTISGRTGRQIWVWGDSVTYADGDIEAVRCDKDFNGDGVKDVLVSASGSGQMAGRHAIVCLNGLNGNVIFYYTESSEFTADVVSTQYGGALGLGSNSGTYSLQGFDNSGNSTWSYNAVNGKIWSMKVVPTINADTAKEIIGFYGFSGNIFCVGSNNGVENWTMSTGTSNAGFIKILDDLDSNGYADFTLSGPQSLYRIDSKIHSILWSRSVGMSYIRGVDFLSDLTGDGKREIVYAMQTPGNILVVNGVTGNTIFSYSFGSTVTYRADRVAALNSIDGNSTTEFVGGCRDGRLVCFSGGQNTPIGINQISSRVPDKFNLYQNYPNPFNPMTNIKFDVSKSSKVTLNIFDVSGREITSKVFENLSAGTYEYRFDGSVYSSGVYFYRIIGNGFISTKKMVLIK